MNRIVYKKGVRGRLHTETLELLNSRPRNVTLEAICSATGINLKWLQTFSTDKSKDPSVNRVEVLNLYLKSLKS